MFLSNELRQFTLAPLLNAASNHHNIHRYFLCISVT